MGEAAMGLQESARTATKSSHAEKILKTIGKKSLVGLDGLDGSLGGVEFMYNAYEEYKAYEAYKTYEAYKMAFFPFCKDFPVFSCPQTAQ